MTFTCFEKDKRRDKGDNVTPLRVQLCQNISICKYILQCGNSGKIRNEIQEKKVKHKWMNFCLPDRKGLEKYFCSKNENVDILLHVIEYIVGLPNFVQVLFHGQLATQA